MRMPAHSALSITRVGDLPRQRNHTQLLQQNGIEGDFVETIENFPSGLRRTCALDRVDLHENCIVRLTFSHQGRDGGVAGVAAVPIILALDLTAWNMVGRQADASSTSSVISRLRNTRPWPARTFVAVTNSFIG